MAPLPSRPAHGSADVRQDDLPPQARAYVEFIEQFCGVSGPHLGPWCPGGVLTRRQVKIGWIGTGPSREDMIIRV